MRGCLSVGTKPHIQFPSDRDLAVHFVGKCARHGDKSSVIVLDFKKAAFLCKTVGGTDKLLNFKGADSVHHISYKDGKTRAQLFHIQAFVLAYTNIGLRKMLRRFPHKDVLWVCADDIYVKGDLPPQVEEMLVEDHPRYGHWRHKKLGDEWRPDTANWKIEHSGQLELPTNEKASPLP